MMPAPTLTHAVMPFGAQTWDKGLWFKQDGFGRVFFYNGSEWCRSTRRALPLGLSKYQIDILTTIAKACDSGALYAHRERHVHCLNTMHWKGLIEQAENNSWRITAAGRGYLKTCQKK